MFVNLLLRANLATKASHSQQTTSKHLFSTLNLVQVGYSG